MAGLKPMVELMTINFSLLAIDQIVNNASKLHYMSNGQINVPIVIRMAGGAGSQLGAQHSHSLESWYAHVPGLKVAVPATPYDAKGLLMTAFVDENPVIFIEHTALYASKGEVPEEPYRVPFGKAEVYREGRDVTIIGYSGSVHQAHRAAQKLAEHEVDAEVLNLRTLRPLDVEGILASVRKTHRAVVVEDDWRFGGFAGEIVSIIQEQAFDDLDAPVLRCSGADVPMPYAGALEQAALPHEDAIVRLALELV
jgi:pyruvate dehydrogenase E1 component beta subunit